jgi:predicted ribosome quality control (RQC) complex YloA/Tae2 family protein
LEFINNFIAYSLEKCEIKRFGFYKVSFFSDLNDLDLMEKIEEQIVALEHKISFIETLLEKDYSDWTNKEKNKYGNHEQLREKEKQLRREKEQLREEKKQLREKENQLRREKEQLREEKNLLLRQLPLVPSSSVPLVPHHLHPMVEGMKLS